MNIKLAALTLVLSPSAFAAVVTTDWQSITPSTATGLLDGVTVTSVIEAGGQGGAIHDSIQNNIFDSFWQAPNPLPPGTEAIGIQPINPGTRHVFSFSAPVSGLRLYIDNFDSFSTATLTATGATAITLLGASPSFVFTSLTANTCQLTTTNGGFNGESDGIIEFSGPVTAVQMSYSAGIQNNGNFYTFAVPEPASFALAACGAAFLLRRPAARTGAGARKA